MEQASPSSKRQRKTYRIVRVGSDSFGEIRDPIHVWSGMSKGRMEGAMMVLNALYGTASKSPCYQAICEQTGHVADEAGGKGPGRGPVKPA